MRPLGPRWREPDQNEMMMLTLYEKPKDYPEDYVVRAWYVAGGRPAPVPSPIARLFATRQHAEQWVARTYPQASFVPRADDDEAQILGVWL